MIHRAWDQVDVPVWLFVPNDAKRESAPLLVMMHGAKRNARSYLEGWKRPAEEGGFIVIAPQFSQTVFPGSRRYNLGGVTGPSWPTRSAFDLIEPIVNQVRKHLGSHQRTFTLYGHSAGAQFVHRYLYFKPNAPVARYLIANAGWYTLPDLGSAYPYGLGNSPATEAAVRRALSEDVVVLIGDRDNDPQHPSLRRTPEADEQGAHRFARGKSFFQSGQRAAIESGLRFEWRLEVVPEAGHSNAMMADAASKYVR